MIPTRPHLLRLLRSSTFALVLVAGFGLASPCQAAAPAAAPAAPSYVLPPGAAAQISRMLDLDRPFYGVRLSASIEKDRVVVQGAKMGRSALRITLVHPSVAPSSAVNAGGVALLLRPGPAPEAEVKALLGRIKGSGVTLTWQALQAPASRKGGEGEPEGDDPAPERDFAEVNLDPIWLQIEVKKPERARALLEALPANIEPAMAILTVVMWRAIGDEARAKKVAAGIAIERPSEKQALRAALGQVESAAEVFDALTEVRKSDPCAGLDVAEVWGSMGRHDLAADLANRIRKAAAACEHAWELEVSSLVQLGRNDEAEPVSREAVERFPDAPAILNARASLLRAQHRFVKAAEVLERIARMDPTVPGRLRLLNSAVMMMGQQDPPAHKRFMKRLEAAVAADTSGEDVVARFQVGVSYHYGNRFEESNALLRPLEKVIPLEHRLHIYLAMNDFNLGHRQEALDRLERATRLPGDDPDIFYCKAEILRDTDRKEALASLQRYMHSSIASPLANRTKQKRVQKLIEALKGCIERGDETCEAGWEHPRLEMARKKGARPSSGALPDDGPGEKAPGAVSGEGVSVARNDGIPPWLLWGGGVAFVLAVLFMAFSRKARRRD